MSKSAPVDFQFILPRYIIIPASSVTIKRSSRAVDNPKTTLKAVDYEMMVVQSF